MPDHRVVRGDVHGEHHGVGRGSARHVAPRELVGPRAISLELALAPIRAGIWAESEYHLTQRAKDLFFDETNTYGIYPTARFESGSGVTLGARFVHRDLFGAREHFARCFAHEWETGLMPDEVNYDPKTTPPDRTRQLCNVWKADRALADIVRSSRIGSVGAPPPGAPPSEVAGHVPPQERQAQRAPLAATGNEPSATSWWTPGNGRAPAATPEGSATVMLYVIAVAPTRASLAVRGKRRWAGVEVVGMSCSLRSSKRSSLG